MSDEVRASLSPTFIQAHTVAIVAAGVYLEWPIWLTAFCLLPLFFAMHMASRTAFIKGGTAELKRINKRWQS